MAQPYMVPGYLLPGSRKMCSREHISGSRETTSHFPGNNFMSQKMCSSLFTFIWVSCCYLSYFSLVDNAPPLQMTACSCQTALLLAGTTGVSKWFICLCLMSVNCPSRASASVSVRSLQKVVFPTKIHI